MDNIKASLNYEGSPNHAIITTKEGNYLQSYKTIVVFMPFEGQTILDPYYDYSRTTMKYVGKFLNHTTQETRKRIKSGKYIVKDLN